MLENRSDWLALSDEDRARMARLYEEVRGRLDEMALITARTLGVTLPDGSVARFAPAAREARDGGVDLEIICTPEGCYCYDYVAGTCGPCEGSLGG